MQKGGLLKPPFLLYGYARYWQYKIIELMKKLILSITAAMLCGSVLPAFAQNSVKHIDNAENSNLDYNSQADVYALSGNTYPSTIAGMSNMAAFGGNLSKIQLQILDNALNTQWFKTYATADEVTAVQDGSCPHLATYFTTGDAKTTKDGGYIVCGRVRVDPETSGCPGPTYDHLFLLKTDGHGNVQWYKRYFDPNMNYGMLNSVIERNDGGFIACGHEMGNYAAIIGTDAGGNLQWARYAQPPAYWDPTIVMPGNYYEVTRYKDYYALVGVDNTFGEVWGGTIVTVVDNAGNQIASNVIDNENWGYVLVGRGINDAYDGDVAITGWGGAPCQTGSQAMVMKLDPISMAVNFLRVYSYNNYGDVSWGNSIVPVGDRFCVTGRDATISGEMYIETDYSGNLIRYNVQSDGDASVGHSIVFNNNAGIPAYAGNYFPGTEATFIVQNNTGRDCKDDIYMPEYKTPYEIFKCPLKDAPFKQKDDKIIDFKMEYKEYYVCGQPKNGTTSVAKIPEGKNIGLYPNPANNTLNVSVSNTFGKGVLKIYDMTGKEVISQTVSSIATSINIASLPAGTYMLKAVNTQGISDKATFIKE